MALKFTPATGLKDITSYPDPATETIGRGYLMDMPEQIRDYINPYLNYLPDTGVADAYVVTSDPAPTVYAAGMERQIKTVNANTGASTLKDGALAAVAIKKYFSDALVLGDILAGGQYTFRHNGTYWQLLNPSSLKVHEAKNVTSGTQPHGLSLNKLNATVAPTINEDSGDGYGINSIWCDVTADKVYICIDATVGAAVWKEITVTSPSYAWQAWTPTLTWTTGTPTGIATIARYITIGKICFYYITITATNGQGATALTISIPAVPRNDSTYVIATSMEVVGGALSNPYASVNEVSQLVAFSLFATATAGQTLSIYISGQYEIA